MEFWRKKNLLNNFLGVINKLIWEVFMFAIQSNSYVLIGQLYQGRQISEATFQAFVI